MIDQKRPYEYRCPKCKKVFEVWRSIGDLSKDVKCACGCMAKRVYVKSYLHGLPNTKE